MADPGYFGGAAAVSNVVVAAVDALGGEFTVAYATVAYCHPHPRRTPARLGRPREPWAEPRHLRAAAVSDVVVAAVDALGGEFTVAYATVAYCHPHPRRTLARLG